MLFSFWGPCLLLHFATLIPGIFRFRLCIFFNIYMPPTLLFHAWFLHKNYARWLKFLNVSVSWLTQHNSNFRLVPWNLMGVQFEHSPKNRLSQNSYPQLLLFIIMFEIYNPISYNHVVIVLFSWYSPDYSVHCNIYSTQSIYYYFNNYLQLLSIR